MEHSGTIDPHIIANAAFATASSSGDVTGSRVSIASFLPSPPRQLLLMKARGFLDDGHQVSLGHASLLQNQTGPFGCMLLLSQLQPWYLCVYHG